MNLGCEDDARLIYRRRRTGYGPLPKGWKKLGAGAFRTTYLSPDKVVYKICRDKWEDWNTIEARVFRRIRKSKVRLPRDWRVAKTKLYSFKHKNESVNIIAMEYVEGTHPKLDWCEDDVDAFFDKIGATKVYELLDLTDLHEGNFVVTATGKKVIIDLGE